jgi:hypothetical protein
VMMVCCRGEERCALTLTLRTCYLAIWALGEFQGHWCDCLSRPWHGCCATETNWSQVRYSWWYVLVLLCVWFPFTLSRFDCLFVLIL